MANPYVYPVGDPIPGAGDQPDVIVGVDYDSVTIHLGKWVPGGGVVTLGAQLEPFVAALVAASWAAGQNTERMRAEPGDPDGSR